MKRILKVVATAIVGVAAFGTVFATAATAGCPPTDANGAAIWQRHVSWVRSAVYRPASFVRNSDRDDDGRGAAIVGFWHVTFVSKGSAYIPDGTVVDSAYVQWHSDGTEIMNSSRPPATGSFCLGVWTKTGPSTYRLNHVGLSWNPDGTPLGPANIREEVALDHSGNKYTGTFSIVQYDLSGTNVLVPTPIVGVITGQRITAN
jgi:hypothetical protein